MNLLSTVLFVCVLLSNVTSQACSVGKYYKSKSRFTVSNIGGYWYLNVEAPATCSGSIDQYRIRYFDNNLSNRTYYATFAIWKPTGGGSYEKDNNTVLSYSFYFNGGNKEKTYGYRKRDLQTERPNLSSPAGVRKGSVIGVYLGTSNPIQLIGSFYYINKYFYAGVCRTAGNVSAIKIDCSNGSNVQDQILNAEVLITVVDCGNVPNVTNAIATLVDGDTQYGATVQYNCSIGYMPIGNSTITCPLNGSWPRPLNCIIVECGDRGAPLNGHTMGKNFTYGSTVTFSCDTGYKLQGNETALCQANGQWSSHIPLCLIIDCPDPGISNNETILLTSIFTSIVMNTTTVSLPETIVTENIFSDTRLTIGFSSALILSIASIVIITLVLTVVIVCKKKSKKYKLRQKENIAITTGPCYETPTTLNEASEPMDENTLTEKNTDYDRQVVSTTDTPMTECPAYAATTRFENIYY